jgi:hypothetical protein
MDKIGYLPLNTTAQARVAKVNNTKSAKLGTYSTILQFVRVVKGDFGTAIANLGFFGVALTDESTEGKLKIGDMVNVQIVAYRESEYNGQTNTAAQVLLLSKVEDVPARVQAAAPVTAEQA